MNESTNVGTIIEMEREWTENPRWKGVERPYDAAEVHRLRGTLQVEHTLARHGAEKLWRLMKDEPYVNALGALTGNQAMQQVRAGLNAIYLSGWQVAADANNAGQMYPDQSLYPASSVPDVVRRINNTLMRADQIQALGRRGRDRLVRADRGRRRGRVRRRAECARVDEGHDRGRSRRGPLRGPAGVGQEMRPYGRQGTGAHGGGGQQAGRGPARGRHRGRTDDHRGPHRRHGCEPADGRHR